MRSNYYKVAIHCQTFNHARFIEDMLKGIVMQKTEFPFIAVVIDDCSTDGNAEIIRKYEAEYPDIIKGIYLTENHYSQQKSIWPYWGPYAESCEYLAICEGDDYWTDPLKLQKQVDLMDKHPEYTLCLHNAVALYMETGEKEYTQFGRLEDRSYSAAEMIKEWQAATASFLYRASVLKAPLFGRIRDNKRLIISDIVLVTLCGQEGTIHAIPDTMCVYRRHAEGFTMHMTPELNYRFGLFWKECRHLFNPEYAPLFREKEIMYYVWGLISSVKGIKPKYAFLSAIHCLRYPIPVIKRLLRIK